MRSHLDRDLELPPKKIQLSTTENGDENICWHTLTIDQALTRLGVKPLDGLVVNEVAERTKTHGKNSLDRAKQKSVLKMIVNQFTDFMVLVLIGAAVISLAVGEREDTIAIAFIVVLNAALGFVQEFRAENAIESLRSLVTSQAKVLRTKQRSTIAADALVPGDIVFLEAGDVVPADLRLGESFQLHVDESLLTGESASVEKNASPLSERELNLGDRFNIAYKGTQIVNGRGWGVVIATGMQTELGHIALLLGSQKDTKTPLQNRLSSFGKRLSFFVIALCLVIFIAGLLRNEDPLLMFMTALSLAVAAIPEALPVVVTVSLALGARRMVRQHALIRKLPAVETLGSVTYICTDKTGTLTQNHMSVFAGAYVNKVEQKLSDFFIPNDEISSLLLKAMTLNNDASFDKNGIAQGDPTETALLVTATQFGISNKTLAIDMPRIGELPFSSVRQRMTTLHRSDSQDVIVFTKGSPEKIVACCNCQVEGHKERPLNKDDALRTAEQLASAGMRVLAYAYKKIPDLPQAIDAEKIESDLTLIGFIGLMDPPRPGVKEAIELCQTASTKVVMITGDHPATATAIARALGIIGKTESNDSKQIINGQDLNKLSPEDFSNQVEGFRVYARASPEQKIRIVNALKEKGECVAMTGDGVNDAPALKSADIGIAMGKMGTDVAREASHMVLLDDNFATIVKAISEGRRIFDNIRKFLKFVLAGNAAEIWTLSLAPLLGLPIPFLPIHLLWINVITDGLPGIALATEPAETNIMTRPPRRPNESVFAGGLWQHILWAGLVMAAVNLSILAWAYHSAGVHWQSMVFTVLTLSQLCHVFAVRSAQDSCFKKSVFSNRPLILALLITFIFQMAILYIPFLNTIFKTEPLTASELAICFAVSPIILCAVEIEKWLKRKKLIYQSDASAQKMKESLR